MKITKLEVQKNNKDRVNVYIDEDFAFGIFAEIVYSQGLSKNMEIDKDFIENVVMAEERIKAKNLALNFLGYRMRSGKEIEDRLKKEKIEENIVEETMDFLERNNLIDDLAFATAFAKDKINLRNYGPNKIKYELYQKGIDSSTIEQVLSLDSDEYNRCLEAGNKKLPSYRNDDYQKKYRKLSGFLQRRGFSYSIVRDVVNELLKS